MHRPIRAMFVRSFVGLVTVLGCASEAREPVAAAAPQEVAPVQRVPRAKHEPPRKIRRPSPGRLDAAVQAQLLSAHNAARSQVGVSALVWSDEVAETARRWASELAANGCGLQHNATNTYGENLYWTTAAKNGTEVTAAWTAEAANYDPQTNTCAQGQVCGHYTQVVWGNTTTLGCGVGTCGSTQVWVCNYDPPGNYLGQRPF